MKKNLIISMAKYKYPFFKKIDIFGIPPLFTIRGRTTFQTQIGSFLTILSVVLISIYLSYFLREMFDHKSPNIYSTVYYDEEPPEINLKKHNFSFIFALQNKDYINYIDNSIYYVNATQTKLTLNKNGIYYNENIPLKIIKCNEYKFEIIPEQFKKLPLDNLYCLDNDLNLKGEYMKDWNYIRLNFSKCKNTTENRNSCKTENEINELLNGGYIGMFIPDYHFQPNIYEKPIKTHIRNLYKSFSIKYFEDIFLYFKLVEIITDSGYFFDDKSTFNFIEYDYLQNDIDFRESKHFLSLTIRASSKREIHKRTYIKLQAIFSNIGGMLKIILLVGDYSVYFIRVTLYKNYILEFFNLDESEIRLKQIRKIYKLPGNNIVKNNIDTIFPNLSYMDNSLPNIIRPSNKMKSSNNLRFNTIEEKSESNIYNKDDSPVFNQNKSKTKNLLFSFDHNSNDSPRYNKTIKQNNYFLSENVFNKTTGKIDKKITKTLLYRKGGSNLINKINNNHLMNTVILNKKNVNLKTQLSSINKKNPNKSKVKISNTSAKYDRRKSNLSNKSGLLNRNISIKFGKTITIPKTQLRIIKVPGFCSDFVCKKNTFKTIKQVHENYKEIQFLLDIVHYLKSENELNIIGKYLFSEEQRRALSYTYTFKADFGLERQGYEYMIKHKKNKLDEKEINENSQSNLLTALK